MTRPDRDRQPKEHPFVRLLGRAGWLLEWAGFLFGLALIATCAAAGFEKGGPLLGVGALLGGTVVALFLVGLVFLIARLHLLSSMREDIETIKRSLEERGESPGGSQGGE